MLVSRVEFRIRATNHDLGKRVVKNADDIVDYIQHNLLCFPLELSLDRTVYVRDVLSSYEIPVKTTNIEFCAVEKLVYLEDVISHLACQEAAKVEISRTYILKQNKDAPLLFYKKNIKFDEEQALYVCRPVNELDVVTDPELKQILPTNTGKVPSGLSKFLEKTTEHIK